MVIVALDYPSEDAALQFVDKLDCASCALKVGFQLFVAAGPKFVEKLASRGFKVFLDLKFHDIPNTVAQACTAAAHLGVWMMNVHASGGEPMMSAAREALDKFDSQRPYLVAVTVLTSMNQQTLESVGVSGSVDSIVSRWVSMAQEAKLDGVVSSAQEAALIRSQSQPDFMIVTPGIRLSDGKKDDQHRVVSPAEALNLGVTHIVVGRPITQAKDPCATLEVFQKAFSSA